MKLTKYICRIVFIFFFFIINGNIQGQNTPISNGTIDQCGGFILDSGAGASQYSNNEDIEMTICPESPDSVLNLSFNLFNLGVGDSLTIYDGESNAGPLIGTYGSTELQGETISTSETNDSGCITLHFISDDADVGDFSAEVSCGFPCEPPVAVVETDQGEDTLFVCIGEEVEFDGTNSTVAPGYTIEDYNWVWDDGSESSTGGLIQSHSFDSPGGYKVNLFITDNNDCTNNNLTQQIVLVSTQPDFSGTTNDTIICFDEEVQFNLDLIGQTDPITWVETPEGGISEEVYLEDDQCTSSTIVFSDLENGAVVESPQDIQEIFVNMEQSYMGDLNISIICPNGQSLILQAQDGGGTDIGNANPGVSDDLADQGEGFDYYWSPDATNGTWTEYVEANNADPLPSGEYSAFGDWNNLVGCPLNGAWEFEVCDNWGGDDGWLFDWTINFDPSLYPELITFTPSYGDGCDSSNWTLNGEPVVNSGNCNEFNITPESTGSFDYVYSVTDNFGCTFRDTVNVQVEDAPEIAFADSLMFYCGDDLELSAEITNPNPVFNGYDFEWSPANLVSPSNSLSTTASGITESTTFTFSAHPEGMPGCTISEDLEVIVNPPGDPGEDSVAEICESDDPVNMFNLLDGTPESGGEWTNGNDTLVDQVFNPAVDTSGTYFYTVWVEDCSYTSQLEIEVLRADITASPDTTICIDGTAQLTASTNSGFEMSWIWNSSNSTNDTITVQPDDSPEVYTVHGEFGPGCLTNEESIVVNQYQSLQMDLMDDTTICYNDDFPLEAELVTGGLTPYEFTWTSETGEVLEGNGAITSLTDTTEFCLEVADACETPSIEECVTISVYPQIDSTFTADTLYGCEPLLVNFTPNGDTAEMNVAAWSFGDGQSQTNAGVTSHLYQNLGEYDVTFEIVSNEGCVYTYTEENFIDVYQLPVAQFSPEPETAILPNTTFEFTNLSFENDFNEWTFDEFGISDEENPVIEIPTNGTEIIDVQLVVMNEEGCVDTTSRTVYIQEEFQMYIPNAFTPNGDGINDYFDLTGIDVDPYDFKLYIYDRWGNLVHFTNDITEGWDGSYQRGDHYVANDVYVYRIVTRSLTTNEKKEVVGHVTVVR